MNEVLAKVQQIGVIPVIAIEDAAKAVPLARALTAGGMREGIDFTLAVASRSGPSEMVVL